jgi:hypothetical protein
MALFLAHSHADVAPVSRQAAVAVVIALAGGIIFLVDAQPVRQVDLLVLVMAAVVEDLTYIENKKKNN